MKTSTASPQQHRTASACKPYILEVGVAVLELVHPKANACKSLPSGQARVPHKNEAVSWCLAARDGVRWNGVTLIPDLGMVSQVCVCVWCRIRSTCMARAYTVRVSGSLGLAILL